MKNLILLFLCTLLAASAFGQAVNVTTTGVDVGVATTTAAGALIKINGQEISFSNQNGISAPDVRLVVKPDGKVGVGTNAPTEKLEVAGNLKVNSAVLSPSGAAPMYVARAWVNFDGTGAIGADQSIRGGGNISRVNKASNGTYTIYFTVPMPDSNYAVQAISHDLSNASGKVVSLLSATATEVQIQVRGTGGSTYNSPIVSITVIR